MKRARPAEDVATEHVLDAAGVTAITFVFAMIVGMPIFFGVIGWLSGRRN